MLGFSALGSDGRVGAELPRQKAVMILCRRSSLLKFLAAVIT